MLIRITLALIVPLTAVRAEEGFDPASLMPRDTIAYASFDAEALRRGLQTLDLYKLVTNEKYKQFLAPLVSNWPMEEIRTLSPVKEWINGVAAAGVRAVTMKLRGFDGSYETVRLEPGKAPPKNLVNLLVRAGMTGPGPAVIFGVEGVAVIEPGERLRKWLNAYLENPPAGFEASVVQRGERQILTIKFAPFEEDDIWFAPEFHVDLTDKRWIVATSAELLKSARTQRASLADNASFAAARTKHTSGERVAFGYTRYEGLFALAKPFLPDVLQSAMVVNGLQSMTHAAVGYSIVNGGVRESVAIGLTESPKGFWRLLDAFPAGVESVKRADPKAVGHIALKVDLDLWNKRVDEVFGELLPGAETLMRESTVAAFARLGIDYDAELVAALGDETAMSFYPGMMGFVPEMFLDMKVRDADALKRLMAKVSVLLANEGMSLKENEEGWRLVAPIPADLRLHGGHLLAGTNKTRVRRVIAKWDDADRASLATKGDVFKIVCPDGADGYCVLVYADLRRWLPSLATFAAGTGMLDNGPFDMEHAPNFNEFFSGMSGMSMGLRRDKDGVSYEGFGPIGSSSMLGSAAAFLMLDRVMMAPVPVRAR